MWFFSILVSPLYRHQFAWILPVQACWGFTLYSTITSLWLVYFFIRSIILWVCWHCRLFIDTLVSVQWLLFQSTDFYETFCVFRESINELWLTIPVDIWTFLVCCNRFFPHDITFLYWIIQFYFCLKHLRFNFYLINMLMCLIYRHLNMFKSL